MAITLAERAAATRQLLLKQPLPTNDTQPPNFSLSRVTQDEVAIASDIQPRPETKPVRAEACNPKWNAEDQTLIDCVLRNWNDAFFANHKEARERLQYEISQGPDGIEAKTGSLQNVLRFLKQEFEKLNNQKKDAQISTATHYASTGNAINPDSNESFNVVQNYTWLHEEQELMNWFMALRPEQLPAIPFLLSAGVTVVSSKFFDRIKLEIAVGASSPRSRTGALQHDLQKLKLLVKEATK